MEQQNRFQLANQVSTSFLRAIKEIVSYWSELPPPILENIYSCLNREDSSRMSVVCKNWSQEYSNPSLWRKMKFVLPGSPLVEIYPEVKFTQKYGYMFRHVEIICNTVQSTTGVTWRDLNIFLQALTFHSKLLSLSFINMDVYFEQISGIEYDDVIKSIMSLLVTQHKLITVEFRNSKFNSNIGADVFRTICLNNSSTLKSLNLEGFVDESYDDGVIINIDIASTYETLNNLQEIFIDYSQMFENIITACVEYADSADSCQIIGSLKRLKLWCDGTKKTNCLGIPPASWQCLRKKWPALKIDFTFHDRCLNRNRSKLQVFITKYMPIRSLHFIRNRHNAGPIENEIGAILRHLTSCEVNVCLEEMSILYMRSSSNLSIDLILFLQECPRLNALQLYIQHPVEALDTVLNFWLRNEQTSLKLVHITVLSSYTRLTTQDAAYYINLADAYTPLLNAQGLHLILLVDSVLRPDRS